MKSLSSNDDLTIDDLKGWQVIDRMLVKTWYFEGDITPLQWVNQIWKLAQGHHHHPDITLSYGRVTVRLTTHDLSDLSPADFKLASEIDLLQ